MKYARHRGVLEETILRGDSDDDLVTSPQVIAVDDERGFEYDVERHRKERHWNRGGVATTRLFSISEHGTVISPGIRAGPRGILTTQWFKMKCFYVCCGTVVG
jgi:hypothetical protein